MTSLSGEGGFDHAQALFAKHLIPRFAGKPIRYLEIGVYYGESAIWMMQNVMTHPDSWVDLVDSWSGNEWNTQEKMDAIYDQAITNLQPCFSRYCIYRMTSENFFRLNGIPQYDLIYIDGDHRYQYALTDGHNAMQHIKPGGVIIFDDANLRNTSKAISDFEIEFSSRLEPFYKSRFQKAFVIKKA